MARKNPANNRFSNTNKNLKGASESNQINTESTPETNENETSKVEKTDSKVIETPEVNEVATNEPEVPDTDPEVIENSNKLSRKEINDIFRNVPKKNKNVAKTFYMEQENLEKLEKLAKHQKVSVSRALNELIRNFL